MQAQRGVIPEPTAMVDSTVRRNVGFPSGAYLRIEEAGEPETGRPSIRKPPGELIIPGREAREPQP